MRRLILMRHAKSDWSQGTSDHDRPLNARGRDAARALGNWLRSEALLPDSVLSSSAARTQETCRLLNLPPESAVAQLRQLYLADPDEILETLRGQKDGKAVLLIAHNPGIANAAADLLHTPPNEDAFRRYPSGATTVVDIEIDDWADLTWGSSTLRAFTVPKELV